jgi:hypothetical protein
MAAPIPINRNGGPMIAPTAIEAKWGQRDRAGWVGTKTPAVLQFPPRRGALAIEAKTRFAMNLP